MKCQDLKIFFRQLTKIWEGAPPEVKVELVPRGAVAGVRDGLVALQVVLGAVIDGVGELVVAVHGAVGPGHGRPAVEALGLVKHHFSGLPLTDVAFDGT